MKKRGYIVLLMSVKNVGDESKIINGNMETMCLQTDRPTHRPTLAKQYTPSSSKGQ
jgi:hypothetical protein